MKFFTGGWMSC